MIIKKILNIETIKEQLEEGEELKFLFKSNYTPIGTHNSERVNCKNGHFNFISNYMGFYPNVYVQIKCNECDEIIFEHKPYAVRTRELIMIEILHSCKSCKELTRSFHPDDDWYCRKSHIGLNINKTNDCPDYDKKEE